MELKSILKIYHYYFLKNLLFFLHTDYNTVSTAPIQWFLCFDTVYPYLNPILFTIYVFLMDFMYVKTHDISGNYLIMEVKILKNVEVFLSNDMVK
jgi:hypothetical protein